MKIVVLGAGYVGLSNSIILARKNSVQLIDTNESKIKLLESKKSPIGDPLIEEYLSKKNLSLTFGSELGNNLSKVDVFLVAIPTNFNGTSKSFDTLGIEETLRELQQKNFKGLVDIRSTVPIGFTENMQKKFCDFKIAFFPEFLRENHALEDSLYPSRIICGAKTNSAKKFLRILKAASLKTDIDTITTSATEAETIKLFSNTFLAMRISFFNELDSFAISKNLNAKDVIDGVCLDPRIGNYYNNPSFGYGGYCLPKDTKQLRENFADVPQKLIDATIDGNKLRKKFITQDILNRKIKKIGIYRLSMKKDSNNWRESAVIDIIKNLKKEGARLIIFEPFYQKSTFFGCKVENNLEKFMQDAELIIANRISGSLKKYKNIIYSRDLFNVD